ncbi:MAG: putative Ig domain-containing protein [Caldilineaceae bacterium]
MDQRGTLWNNLFSLLLIGALVLTMILQPVADVWAQADLPPSDTDVTQASNQLYLPLVANGADSTPQNDGPGGQSDDPPLSQPAPDPTPSAPTTSHEADDYALAEAARQRNEPPFVAPANAAVSGPVNVVGRWDAPVTWPFAFAAAASLPDGRILAWGGNNPLSFSGGSTTYAAIWDPAVSQLQSVNRSDHSMFCAIPTMLEDGRVFVNGGDGTRERTSIFDYRTNQWTRVEDMNTGRWYPGSVALPSGQVFTAIGDPGGPYPEIWTPGQGWTLLTGASLQAPILNYSGYQNNWLPYLHLAPNGRIFHAGPTPQMNWIDPSGNGAVSNAGLVNSWYPKYGTVVMYDEGKLLMAGGAANNTSTAPGTNKAAMIDLTGVTPQKIDLAPMANARKFNNGVILPTGEVMIVGGNTSGTEFSDQGTILTPEIWNPTTRAWRSVADLAVPRNYHSVALLMTDGRVWSGGGGLCNCSADHPDHQVYWPPYLFNKDGSLATRPVITAAPDVVTYGRTITVQATVGIQKFSLIKFSALTHVLNSDLRYLSVPFSETSAGSYQLALHSNKNVLTPGFWMLFAVNSQGTPSVAKVLKVSNSNAPSVNPPGDQSNFVGDNITLPIVAADPNGDALTFSATGLPTGLTIDAATGLISGSTTASGVYAVAVIVSDGGKPTTINFTWTVTQPGTTRFVKLVAESEVNGNPWSSAAEFNVVDAQGNTMERRGWTITADSQETQGEDGRAVNAIDGNTNTIWHTEWSVANPPPPHWLVVDLGGAYTIGGFRYLPRQSGAINGTVAAYQFYLSADGVNWGAPVAQGQWTNDRTEKVVTLVQNRPPTLVQPAAQNNTVGDNINLSLSANDPDGDLLTFSVVGLPVGLTLDTNSGIIRGAPTAPGSYTVTVTVQDGRGAAASQSFVWTIQALPFTLNPLTATPVPVNTSVHYVASVNNGANLRVKWLFGDGVPETAYQSDLAIDHSFTQPGIYLVKLTVTDDSGVEKSQTFAQAVHLPLTTNQPVASMSVIYEARSGNDRIWNVNPDNDTVSVFDAVTNNKVAEIAVGRAPRSLALAANGRVWVTNKGAATLSLIDTTTLAVVQAVNLPYGAQPFGIASKGNTVYVALEGSGELLRFDATSAAQTGSVDVGPYVRHLSLNGAGDKLYVTRFITPRLPGEASATPQVSNGGGEVIVVNTSDLTIAQTITLHYSDRPDAEHSGRGIPNYLGPAVIAPDGLLAWVPSKQDNIVRGSLRDGRNLTFESTVRSITSVIDLTTGAEDYPARLDHDNAGIATTALFDQSGNYLFVALEGSREVAVVDAYAHAERFRINVGRAPQGLALAADGMRLFVHNFMDRTVTVYDLHDLYATGAPTAPLLATYATVATETLSPQVLTGKQLFYDAKDTRLARDNYISCAACHNDGGQDGRVWDLTGFGEGLRNTIDLNGHAGQGPLHWSANFDEVQDFEGQIRALAGGTGLLPDGDFAATSDPLGAPKAGRSADLDALAAYVNSLATTPASPHRNGDGTLTADGVAGKAIFQNANCVQCHGGQGYTDSAPNNLHDIGTLKASSGQRLNGPLTGLDTPTLRGVWATAPYLHDGSAATLADAVNAHSGLVVGAVELNQLVAFLRQLDGSEPAPPQPNRAPTLANPGDQSNLVGDTVALPLSANDPDGDSLTFAASGLPAGLTIHAGTGVIAGTPLTAGVYAVTVTVDDGRGGGASIALTWTVTAPVNHPPTLTHPGNQSNAVNDAVTLSINASDADGHSLTFSATGLPNGLAINNSNGLIAGVITTAGAFNVTVTVDDSHGGVVSGSFTWSVSAQPAGPRPGIYQLVNVRSKRCVDVYGASTANGARIVQWSCHTGNNQKWLVETVGANYRLTAVHSGKVIDVNGGSTQTGAKLIQWPWHGGANQQWTIRPVAGGSYEIVSVNSGLCMDVTNGSTSNGVAIQQWNCNGTTTQRWVLRPQ